MYDLDTTAVATEFKFLGAGNTGEFEGYAAVFGQQDSHGDVIMPGAFRDTLAERKAAGRPHVPMYAQHGAALGGDPLPIGIWTDIQEDETGLKVRGQIAGMDTEHGKRIHSLMKVGALSGLSIGYKVPPGGAVLGTKAGEPRRTIKKLKLFEISPVDDPSQAAARVDEIKAAAGFGQTADADKAAGAVAQAMRLHDKSMSGDSYSYASPKDKALVMGHLRDAHEALTGQRAPDDLAGWKSAPTIREFEEFLREKGQFSRSEATQLAERVFKSAPRDEEEGQAIQPEVKSALDEFHAAAAGFPTTQA